MPSPLEERIHHDMTVAMKARDTIRVGALRMLTTEIKNAKIAKREDLSDDDVLAVLKREAKKRKEAAEAFHNGNRQEQAASEEAELAIVQEYLPQQMSETEVAAIVESVLAEEPNATKQDFGRIMKLVMIKANNRADGSTVSAAVRSALEKRGA